MLCMAGLDDKTQDDHNRVKKDVQAWLVLSPRTRTCLKLGPEDPLELVGCSDGPLISCGRCVRLLNQMDAYYYYYCCRYCYYGVLAA